MMAESMTFLNLVNINCYLKTIILGWITFQSGTKQKKNACPFLNISIFSNVDRALEYLLPNNT